MLILTRNQGERVVITCKKTGVRVVVSVKKASDGVVSLGFFADEDEVSIYREEIQNAIDAKNRKNNQNGE